MNSWDELAVKMIKYTEAIISVLLFSYTMFTDKENFEILNQWKSNLNTVLIWFQYSFISLNYSSKMVFNTVSNTVYKF